MAAINRLEGWYDEEHDGVRPFQWIGREARCRITGVEGDGPFCLQLVVGGREDCRLSVSANDRVVGERSIGLHPSRYVFALEQRGEMDVTLAVDRVLSVEGDARPLGVIVYALDLLDVGGMNAPAHGDGWYEWDDADYFASRWMGREAQMLVPPQCWRRRRFAALPVFGEIDDGSQVLTILRDGQSIVEFPVLPRWHVYDFALPRDGRHSASSIVLRVSRLQPAVLHPSDPRDLGVRVGALETHDDARRHEKARVFHDFCSSLPAGSLFDEDRAVDAAAEEPASATAFAERNAALNQQEFESGAAVLASYPQTVGIDLYAKCNMKPPCVYCHWDVAKDAERGLVNAVVDDRTFDEYGPFFSAARRFQNCSIGEPLLNPRLPQILEFLSSHDKLLEISTNGQAFTPPTIRALAGRQILVYASLDAASARTYSRLRNDRWDDVLHGLIALREARLRARGLPELHLVFMPMRANLHDLEAYFRLCRVVHGDGVVLRPLIQFEHANITADRGGYHFDYAAELLTRREIEAVVQQSRVLARRYGVRVSNQFEYGTDTPASVLT